MFKINKICNWKNIFLALALSVLIAPVYADNKGIITGQVVDTTGMPISGVSVSAKGAPAVTTNPGGVYTLTGVKQKSRILVEFAKAGYAPTQGTVSLVRKEKNDRKDREDRNDDHDDHDDDNHHKKMSRVTFSKTMVKSGATQKLDTALGGSLNEKGFKVTFPANSLTATGSVDVVISPLDVSTRDIAAAPGDFSARTARGQRVTLESFTMADFTITQNGQPVNLKRGSTADIEMLLPTNTPLISGLIKPLWYFNTANGRWQEEGTGSVAPSTTTPGRLAIFASVQHFTFWNSDQPLTSTAVQGRVVDPYGIPVAGASVVSYGVDYAGSSGIATDANGNYCILVRIGSTSSLTASKEFGGIVAQSSPLIITSGTAPTTCTTGGAQLIPNIVLASRTTCISGDVRDASNAPVAGVTVYSTSGGFTNSDINGAFQVAAMENSSVTLFVVGYPTVTVTTPAAGSPCAVVQIRPSVTGGGGTSCVSGLVFSCSPTSPQAGIVINVVDNGNNVITSSTPSNANGLYCIDGLPSNTTMSFRGKDSVFYGPVLMSNTGPSGGSCATNNCNAGPAIDVFCY